jgi:hypothetical protein
MVALVVIGRVRDHVKGGKPTTEVVGPEGEKVRRASASIGVNASFGVRMARWSKAPKSRVHAL